MTAGPAPATPATWRSTGSSPTPTSPARNSPTTPSIGWPPASSSTASSCRSGSDGTRASASGWSSPASADTARPSGPGLKTVACVFADDGLSPSEILQEQIIENLLREDLKPIEQARAYRQLMDLHGWTAKELSGELHVSQGAISKSLSLLTLPAELQGQVEDGAIPATAAYEVAKVEDRAVQREIARRIVDEDLTRDAAAEAVREASGKPARPGAPKAKGRGGPRPGDRPGPSRRPGPGSPSLSRGNPSATRTSSPPSRTPPGRSGRRWGRPAAAGFPGKAAFSVDRPSKRRRPPRGWPSPVGIAPGGIEPPTSRL